MMDMLMEKNAIMRNRLADWWVKWMKRTSVDQYRAVLVHVHDECDDLYLVTGADEPLLEGNRPCTKEGEFFSCVPMSLIREVYATLPRAVEDIKQQIKKELEKTYELPEL